MKKIAIVGAGGFGREVEMLINQINDVTPQWDLIGFIDELRPVGSPIGGSKVLGSLTFINQLKDVWIVLAVGNPALRESVLSRLSDHEHFATLVHPKVLIGERVEIGAGTIICAGTIITTDVIIGRHVVLNLSCTVGHDVEIGHLCSLMPSVSISGEVIIESGVYIGTGARIINHLRIGSNTIVGSGSVVTKSLPSNCTAVGIPAKIIKFHEKER